MPKIFPLDLLTNSVVNLRQEVKPGQFSIGTGTFIANGADLYLWTAEHVAIAMQLNCQFIVKGPNDTPLVLTIDDLTQQTVAIPWVIHKEADIAILKLNPKPPLLTTSLLNRFLPLDNIYKDKKAVDRNTTLTVIGFPNGLGAIGHFSPLTFRTYASSGLITLARFDNGKPCSFIIMENPGVGGYSGGPVIDISIVQNMGMTMTGGGTLVHGILHGTISDQTGGKLAAVTPSYYLFDII
ncbi:MAG: serine protease [Chitinophagaceae bacterium]|nr:MAG: serine protease [Chitinophagaceae bacterium]